MSPTARALMGGAMLAVALLHFSLRLPELRADRMFTRAQPLLNSKPAAFTDQLAATLRIFPGLAEANYAYASILADFHRESEAIRWAERTRIFAPDANREAEALARLYASMNNLDSATKYANTLLVSYPHYLPALELLMEAFKARGRCDAIDSLRAVIAAWKDAYPLPDPEAYTIESMDSLFQSNSEVNFLQRWFGGKALRKTFVESHLKEYNSMAQNHIRFQDLRESHCPTRDSDSSHATKPAPAHWRPFLRGWG